MSLRKLNLKKKWRPCLKCGRKMMTDRCHRICRSCRLSNAGLVRRSGAMSPVSVGGFDGVPFDSSRRWE